MVPECSETGAGFVSAALRSPTLLASCSGPTSTQGVNGPWLRGILGKEASNAFSLHP